MKQKLWYTIVNIPRPLKKELQPYMGDVSNVTSPDLELLIDASVNFMEKVTTGIFQSNPDVQVEMKSLGEIKIHKEDIENGYLSVSRKLVS